MSRRATLAVLALAALSALVAGYLIMRPPSVNESERYRDVITLLGHQRVLAYTTRSAYAVFVGAELSDREVVVSVGAPQVKWSPETAYPSGDLSLVAEGYGRLDGVRCYVKVQRIRPSAAVRIVGVQHLTADQQTGLSDGTLEAIKVAVLCDPQDVV